MVGGYEWWDGHAKSKDYHSLSLSHQCLWKCHGKYLKHFKDLSDSI